MCDGVMLSTSRLSQLPVMHLELQRYCSSGMRYLPQKSTNFICSTLLLKNTPGIQLNCSKYQKLYYITL